MGYRLAMVAPSLDVTINTVPWLPDRVKSYEKMLDRLGGAAHINVGHKWVDKHAEKVQWQLDQWEAASRRGTSHHVFMSDDLALAPRIREILLAMVTARPSQIIGLLCNHPKTSSLLGNGMRWYRTNAWIVATYIMPHTYLVPFLDWYRALDPNIQRAPNMNDDSSINEWVTRRGPGEVWHPLPSPVEHRADVSSAWGNENNTHRERCSWRAVQEPQRVLDGTEWRRTTRKIDVNEMCDPNYWHGAAPMMRVE